MCFCIHRFVIASIRLLALWLQSCDWGSGISRFVKITLKVVIQTDLELVDVILLYQHILQRIYSSYNPIFRSICLYLYTLISKPILWYFSLQPHPVRFISSKFLFIKKHHFDTLSFYSKFTSTSQQLHSNIPISTTEHVICPSHLKGMVAVLKYIPATFLVCLFCIKYVPIICAFALKNLSESTILDVQ